MEQRWNRPLDVKPGHWKKQLPGKYLAIGAKGDLPMLQKLLAKHPEFLNKRGSHNRTLLWEAVRAGKLHAVEFLADCGADIKAVGCYNSESHVQISPYCAAQYYNRPAIATFLKSKKVAEDIFRLAFLGNQAAVVKRLTQDPTLLHAEDPTDEIWYIPLLSFAVAGGHIVLAEFLINSGAVVPRYSAQLFWLAAKQSRQDMIDLILAHGADIQAVESSVFLAVSDLALMRHLLEKGAPVNKTDAHGNTPLLYLIRKDKRARLDKLQLLFDFGLDVNIVGAQGQTALAYAQATSQSAVIDWLITHGASSAAARTS
jgi:ankyrin repeat protein